MRPCLCHRVLLLLLRGGARRLCWPEYLVVVELQSHRRYVDSHIPGQYIALMTYSTVITNFLQYNNTLIPANSTTILVPDATSIYGAYNVKDKQFILPAVPTDLIDADLFDSGAYAETHVDPGFVVTVGTTAFPSPVSWTSAQDFAS